MEDRLYLPLISALSAVLAPLKKSPQGSLSTTKEPAENPRTLISFLKGSLHGETVLPFEGQYGLFGSI